MAKCIIFSGDSPVAYMRRVTTRTSLRKKFLQDKVSVLYVSWKVFVPCQCCFDVVNLLLFSPRLQLWEDT